MTGLLFEDFFQEADKRFTIPLNVAHVAHLWAEEYTHPRFGTILLKYLCDDIVERQGKGKADEHMNKVLTELKGAGYVE